METRQINVRVELPLFEKFQAFVNELGVSQGRTVSQAEALEKLLEGKAKEPAEIPQQNTDLALQIQMLRRVLETEKIGHVELMESLTSLARFTGSIQREGREFSDATGALLKRVEEAVAEALSKLDSSVKILGDSTETIGKAKTAFRQVETDAVYASKTTQQASESVHSAAALAQKASTDLAQKVQAEAGRILASTQDLSKSMEAALRHHEMNMERRLSNFHSAVEASLKNTFIRWGGAALIFIFLVCVVVSSFNYFDNRSELEAARKEQSFLNSIYRHSVQQGCNGRRMLVPEEMCTNNGMKGRTDIKNPLFEGQK